jgi:hypothetical protein
MNDIAGKELSENDIVAFNPPSYKGLVKGRIVGFCPQKVKVEYSHQGRIYVTRTESSNVAKLC